MGCFLGFLSWGALPGGDHLSLGSCSQSCCALESQPPWGGIRHPYIFKAPQVSVGAAVRAAPQGSVGSWCRPPGRPQWGRGRVLLPSPRLPSIQRQRRCCGRGPTERLEASAHVREPTSLRRRLSRRSAVPGPHQGQAPAPASSSPDPLHSAHLGLRSTLSLPASLRRRGKGPGPEWGHLAFDA